MIAQTYRPSKDVNFTHVSLDELEDYLKINVKDLGITDVNSNSKYLLLTGGTVFKGNMRPLEVYGIFECHLFFAERNLPLEIAAIAWEYSSGGIDNSRYQRTTITTEVFSDLYARCNVDGMSRRKAARVLGDQWMMEIGYVKLK